VNWKFVESLLFNGKEFFRGNNKVMLDGLDLLRQLSNVTRTMNAQGITETYSNVIPRYLMLHASYRFNIVPKKNSKRDILIFLS
jgi:hypothetical protein